MTSTPAPDSVTETLVAVLRDLLEQCRLRISNMDPLALRIDQALRGGRGSAEARRPFHCDQHHDHCDRILSESAYRILKAADLR